MWDASKAIHYEMLPLLGGDRYDVHPYILGGVAELQGSNAVMIGWDNFHRVMNVIDSCSRENVIEFLSKLFSFDWTWLNEYFLATEYIEKRKLEFQMKIQQE